MWYDFDVGRSFEGYDTCRTCDGSGKVYTFSSVSVAAICFIIFVFGFLAVFALVYFFSAFRLEANPWVKDVEEMHFLFNPMYFSWLFYVDRKTWVKWNTVISLIFTLLLLAVFVLSLNANQNTLVGWLIGAALTIPFAVAWYQNFESLFDFLMQRIFNISETLFYFSSSYIRIRYISFDWIGEESQECIKVKTCHIMSSCIKNSRTHT